MSVQILQIRSRKDLKRFAEFPNQLYHKNPYFVPQLISDVVDTLDEAKNPAYAFCDSRIFLAYDESDGRVVGRVAAIYNRRANEYWKHHELRYGWLDFIDDREVSAALMAKVEEYGRELGVDKVVGPLGFADFDPEGLLVEGFDQISTFTLPYNHPYYMEHLEALGYTKEIDWLEYRVTVPPEGIPERVVRIAKFVRARYDIRIRKITKRELKREHLAHKIFDLINRTYCKLYDFTVLTPEMIDAYVKSYFPFLDLKLVTLIEDMDGKLIAVGVSMPSIVRAMQKANGHLFPFGWWHILKSLWWKHEPSVELLLIAVDPEWSGRGLNAVIFDDLVPIYLKYGFKWAETNAELETNTKVQAPWENFETVQNKRRRIYGKQLQ